ncbi:MAG: hypothetical protein M1383_01370 [Patescibacteria group bacterium]|nr:hypothetical protein [Patescibacteria group bacterium]
MKAVGFKTVLVFENDHTKRVDWPEMEERARLILAQVDRWNLGDTRLGEGWIRGTPPFTFFADGYRGFVVHHRQRSSDYSGSARFTFVVAPDGERWLVAHSDWHSHTYNPRSEESLSIGYGEKDVLGGCESIPFSPAIET